MKTWVLIAIVAAIVALILGIITQLVGHAVIITAAAWNSFAQTLLLGGIALGVFDQLNKK